VNKVAILNEYYAENTPYSSYDLATMSAAIKAKMKILKMTQMELSLVTGVSQPQLSRILRKDFKKIPQETFASITEALGLPELSSLKKESHVYQKLINKLEQLDLSGEVTDKAWDAIDKIVDVVMASSVQSFPSIAFDVDQPLDYQAGPRTSGWKFYMRALINSVVNEGFRKHEHWNRFAVTRTTAVYQNNKLVTTGETYAEGVLPYQEDVLKVISKVSNPRMGGAYDGFEIRDAAEKSAFQRHEIRYWLYYQKELSGNREVHAHMQFHEPYNSSDIERFTRAVDQFIINSEGER
jgi:transcriptional regulator with XRE-family HTH domain